MSKGLMEGLGLVAAIILFFIILVPSMKMTNSAKDTTQKVGNEMNSMLNTADEQKFTDYDGREDISGSEVLSCITNYQNYDIRITVADLSGNSYYYVEGSNFTTKDTDIMTTTSAKKKSSSNFVNPNGVFTGSITRDKSTNAIKEVKFTQTK